MIDEEIFSTSYSISVENPYTMALNLIEWARSFGAVVERTNKVLSSGSRTKCEVAFVIERPLDFFSHFHIEFDIFGDMALEKLDIKIMCRTQSNPPIPHGFVGKVFHDFYLSSIMPHIFSYAKSNINSILNDLGEFLSMNEKALY